VGRTGAYRQLLKCIALLAIAGKFDLSQAWIERESAVENSRDYLGIDTVTMVLSELLNVREELPFQVEILLSAVASDTAERGCRESRIATEIAVFSPEMSRRYASTRAIPRGMPSAKSRSGAAGRVTYAPTAFVDAV
jgi:hypothetical protein